MGCAESCPVIPGWSGRIGLLPIRKGSLSKRCEKSGRRFGAKLWPYSLTGVGVEAKQKAGGRTSGFATEKKNSDDLFAHRLALGEQIQVIRAAGLGIGARHVESAEGMRAHGGSRALAVDVQVADVEFADGAVNLLARFGVNGAGQAELGVVGNLERVVVILRLSHSQNGAENLFLFQARLGWNISDDGGLQEVALTCVLRRATSGDQSAVLLADLDVFHDRLHGTFVDHCPHVGVLGGIADRDFSTRAFSFSRNLS